MVSPVSARWLSTRNARYWISEIVLGDPDEVVDAGGGKEARWFVGGSALEEAARREQPAFHGYRLQPPWAHFPSFDSVIKYSSIGKFSTSSN